VTPAEVAAAATVAKESMTVLSDFAHRLCDRAADELGTLFGERVAFWRLKNAVDIAKKTDQLMKQLPPGLIAHPRTFFTICDKSSWTDDSELQGLWAGLIASSCDEKGTDESGLIYARLLDNMTGGQARIVKYVIEHGKRGYNTTCRYVEPHTTSFPTRAIMEVAAIDDVNQLDATLDHLNSLEVIKGGFSLGSLYSEKMCIEPTSLGLNLYIRCQGSRMAPFDFFAPIDRERAEQERQAKTMPETPTS
jgi:hypothetical protein